jgi:hypothetical protein
MNLAKALWAAVQGDPRKMMRLHGWLTIAWTGAAFPICIWLAQSIPFLVFISVYAVATGHWASYQGRPCRGQTGGTGA